MASLKRPFGAALAAALTICASPAAAHSFGAGTDAFQAFFEGAQAVALSPVSLLPGLSLGLLLTLSARDGLLRAWPALFAGHVAGFLAAPMVGGWVIPALVALGALVAALATLLPRHPMPVSIALATLTGLMTMLVSLEGHGWLELALPIYLGIFAAASFVVAAGAGVARVALEELGYAWVLIGLRVAASWLAAMQLLMAAFLLAPQS